jgi:hypothetical protein
MQAAASLKKNNFMPHIITIPTPCHEDWNAMTPKDQGRHCGSCCKTVVDFTTWQPQEILLHFKSNKNVCGRFTADQLNEPIPTQEDFVKQISYFNISTVKKKAAIFLFAFMIGASSCNDNNDTMGKSLASISTSTIDTVPIKTLLGDTTYVEPIVATVGLVNPSPIIDTPPKLMGASAIIHKPVIVEKPTLKGDVQIAERPMLMGEPGIVEQPTLMGDTVIQNTPEKSSVCKPVVIKETEFVMGKMIAPKTVKKNTK